MIEWFRLVIVFDNRARKRGALGHAESLGKGSRGNVADYHLDRDEIRLAEECFQRAASLCPGYKYPYFNLAIIRKKEGDAEGSKRYLEKALECDPEYVPALNNLGLLHKLTGKVPAAMNVNGFLNFWNFEEFYNSGDGYGGIIDMRDGETNDLTSIDL